MDVELVNEKTYTFGSQDNLRSYETEVVLDPNSRLSSIHGLLVNGDPIIVVGANGGASCVHEHSMIRLGMIVYFAVGPYVCRMSIESSRLDWRLEVDDATCFGVHFRQDQQALISHVELSISRFNPNGELMWSAGGADVFSERFSLQKDYIEAVDFNGLRYCFDYESGRVLNHS